jgi:alpha-N-acetylglucosamine transferase
VARKIIRLQFDIRCLNRSTILLVKHFKVVGIQFNCVKLIEKYDRQLKEIGSHHTIDHYFLCGSPTVSSDQMGHYHLWFRD